MVDQYQGVVVRRDERVIFFLSCRHFLTPSRTCQIDHGIFANSDLRLRVAMAHRKKP